MGRVLYLHPFAEELNTTRRTVAQQARALAQAGFAVLQIDLLGCGDSRGDFADATWDAWLDDARQGHAWLDAHATGPLWLWGMRSGALLASGLAATLSEPAHLLFWQPVVSGQQMLQQFLRLHAASEWLGNGRTDRTPPAELLKQGQSVHIAGYTLTPALAQGLGRARLQPPALPGRCVWLDMSTGSEDALSPATAQQVATWRAAGWTVDAHTVHALPFWQTVGSDGAPALLQTTRLALLSPATGPT